MTRLIRNRARSQDIFTPALLGLLTVFIPCGTTLVMQSLAISTANPFLGALIMFVFVLGTAPTFLVLGIFATRLRGHFQQLFSWIAAGLILFLGILSLDGGLKLVGSPLAPSRVISALTRSADPISSTPVAGMEESPSRSPVPGIHRTIGACPVASLFASAWSRTTPKVAPVPLPFRRWGSEKYCPSRVKPLSTCRLSPPARLTSRAAWACTVVRS